MLTLFIIIIIIIINIIIIIIMIIIKYNTKIYIFKSHDYQSSV